MTDQEKIKEAVRLMGEVFDEAMIAYRLLEEAGVDVNSIDIGLHRVADKRWERGLNCLLSSGISEVSTALETEIADQFEDESFGAIYANDRVSITQPSLPAERTMRFK